jgi:hypothetical protein
LLLRFWQFFGAFFGSFLLIFGAYFGRLNTGFWFLFLGFCSALKISLNASGMGQRKKERKKGRKARQGKR